MTIKQTDLEAGENEISAGKRLLGKVDLENAHRQRRCHLCPKRIVKKSSRKRRRILVETASQSRQNI